MKARHLGLVFGAALATLYAGLAHADRRVAFVIGNSAYRNVSPLPNTLNDANAIGTLFRSIGFDTVQLQSNLGVLEFKRAVRDFINTAQSADIAVVYYAGHGIESAGMNYLVPVDAKLARDYDVEDEAVSLDRIIWSLQSVKLLRLIIIDACRDNPFVGQMQRSVSTRATTMGLTKVDSANTGTLVAYAAKAGSVSYDGDGPNSPFTTALVKHLAEPGLDIRIALGRVRDEVLKSTGNRQEPFVYGSLGGSTVALVAAPEAPKVAAPAVIPDRIVQQNYEFAERIGTREAWGSFLASYKTGFYADLARAQMEKLNGQRPSATAVTAPAVPSVPAKPPEPAKDQVAKLASPPTRDPPPHPVVPPPQVAAPVLKEIACKQEAAQLASLRRNPVRDELIKFERELVCDTLRPQVQRLRESLMPDTIGAAPPAPVKPGPALAATAAMAPPPPPPVSAAPPAQSNRPGAAEQAIAKLVPPGPARETPARPPDPITPAAPSTTDVVCKQDAERLARLRSDANYNDLLKFYDDLVAFERGLVCDSLKPQVQRLRESLMPGGTAAVAPPPTIATPDPQPALPRTRGMTTTATRGSVAACSSDNERLARLRANPSRDAVATFERELSCEQLRPQLLRLKESIVD